MCHHALNGDRIALNLLYEESFKKIKNKYEGMFDFTVKNEKFISKICLNFLNRNAICAKNLQSMPNSPFRGVFLL
jgi:hypothetical protein